MQILVVMIGGFFGAISRYSLGKWISNEIDNGFPIGTLLINLVGCFFLGWFLTFLKQRKKVRPELSLLIGTGFTGSFTTFSTFSVETVQLWQSGQVALGVLYVVSSILLGLLLAFLGVRLATPSKKEGGTI